MFKNPIPLLAFCLLQTVFLFGQPQQDLRVHLHSGSFIPPANIDSIQVHSFNEVNRSSGGKSFAYIQFNNLPDATLRKHLLEAGMELLEYFPSNAYAVSISKPVDINVLRNAGIRSLFQLQPAQKLHASLQGLSGTASLEVWIRIFKNIDVSEATMKLAEAGFTVKSLALSRYRVLSIQTTSTRLHHLASFPFVSFVQQALPADQPLNNISTKSSKANRLQLPLTAGGRGLKGEGVVIGMGDDSDPSLHIDFSGRIINRAAYVHGYHGTHVMGIIGGAGIRREEQSGYAPAATLLSQFFSGIWVNAPVYIQDYGMVITNNSYGAIIGDCSYNGLYDLYSNILDQQALDFPELQHVFAAGNSGLSSCAPFPAGYRTVLGSYQSAKNVITVGNTQHSGELFVASSKGPVQDGRLKPEISATGSFVLSTVPSQNYGLNTGTSMAAPAVSGGLALLYQRYRQLHGTNPRNALMKALLVNGARDLGNKGPDFGYGIGWMHLERSVIMMEENRYFNNAVDNGQEQTHIINVPAGIASLRVLLYWNDPPANPLAIRTLVNDLDLSLTEPSSSIVLPWVLDTSASRLQVAATRGTDRMNNLEQITIDFPAAGNYSLRVSGHEVPQGPQEYYLVYDFLPDSSFLTYPAGEESMVPGIAETLQWDSWTENPTTFSLEFSSDNGLNWTNIDGAINNERRYYEWTPPSISTNEARIRLTENVSGRQHISEAFSILGQPVVSLATIQCEGYINLQWTAVPGADSYEVLILRGNGMQSVAETTVLDYSITSLSKDTTYWFTVRAKSNGKAGRRAQALSRRPLSGNCSHPGSNGDLKVDAILSPVSGRRFTSTELTATAQVSIRVRNLDNAPIPSYNISYSVNGGAWQTETINTLISGNATRIHNFTVTADLSQPGTYSIRAAVQNHAVDPLPLNDTVEIIVHHLDNTPVDLSSAFLDDLESLDLQEWNIDKTGLAGGHRYDFTNSSLYGRVRSFVNSGIAWSGSRAFTLDAERYFPAGNTNHLDATFNLASYQLAQNDLRLDFRFRNHGQIQHPDNAVWVRGADTDAWIKVYDLNIEQNDPADGYRISKSIELGDILATAGQDFSSSFQVRWGQWGFLLAGDAVTGNGYTIDDIHLYEVFDDVQMISIDTPAAASCDLNASVPVRVTVRNSANIDLNNISVSYRLNGGAIITETIPVISANSNISYTFNAGADLSSIGEHNIEAWVHYTSDSYRANDSTAISLMHSPVFSSFPYLEDFENGAGGWYAKGKNVSWEFGTPASQTIKNAASGVNAWKTSLQGNYNDREESYLYSPCYNISSLGQPMLSFSFAVDMEDCGATTLCDAVYLEYSSDGISWQTLGAAGEGVNWFNRSYSSGDMWSVQQYTRWHVASIPIPDGLDAIRFRFALHSDPFVNREGVAIDDIHIYDNANGVYTGGTQPAVLEQPVNGTNWTPFTENGALVAELKTVHSNGNASVRTFLNESFEIRFHNGQYYHQRNWIVQSTIDDSLDIRLYFSDAETDSLIFAGGCATCYKPGSAYEIGVSVYSADDAQAENGLFDDDRSGNWTFIPSDLVRKVPFDKGYYAYFRTAAKGELWLHNGWYDGLHPLQLQIMNFDLLKQLNDNVELTWSTNGEESVLRYEVELARSNSDYQSGNFEKIGEVASLGDAHQLQSYSFLDTESDKSGVRYYRLKAVHANGHYHYTSIKPVVFGKTFNWQVYPNPNNGLFFLVYQLESGEQIKLQIFDAHGRLLKTESFTADGFVQKQQIDLRSANFPAGVYMIRAEGGGVVEVLRVVKN